MRKETLQPVAAKEVIEAFARAYASSEGVVEDDGVVKCMHSLRRTLLKGVSVAPGEAQWGKAMEAFGVRVAGWVREGRGGALGQVVSLRSAEKVARLGDAFAKDAERSSCAIACGLCEAKVVFPETLLVLEDMEESLWALRGAKRAAKSSSAPFESVCAVLTRLDFGKKSQKATSLMVDAWVALLCRNDLQEENFSDERRLSVLRFVSERVLPCAQKPLRFADFLVSQAATSDPRLTVLGLEGLFFLVARHGLEYPALYDKMLGLFRDSPEAVLDAKHRKRFLGLVTQALKSAYATSDIKIAFAEALSKAACRASPRGVVALLAVLRDLSYPEAAQTARPKVLALTTHYVPAVAKAATDLLDTTDQTNNELLVPDAFTYAHLYAAQPKVVYEDRNGGVLGGASQDEDLLDQAQNKKRSRPLFCDEDAGATPSDDVNAFLQHDLPFLAHRCVTHAAALLSSPATNKTSSSKHDTQQQQQPQTKNKGNKKHKTNNNDLHKRRRQLPSSTTPTHTKNM